MPELMEKTKGAVPAKDGSTSTDSIERFLTFVTDGLTLGVSTNYIIEIITDYMLTPLPMVPGYVKGIINLRGQIIPIVDIRVRLGKPEIEYGSTSCVVVLSYHSISIGIIVDSVEQVLDIDYSKVSPVPAKDQQELVSGLISLPGGQVILMLDCEQLLTT